MRSIAFFVVAFALAVLGFSRLGVVKEIEGDTPLPEFTHVNSEDWINSKPLTVGSLRGKVVLLDFWTFECWNCYRSFPWINSLHDKYGDDGLVIIGVHSPEFERERNPIRVAEKVQEFKLQHPVMIDNDFSYWRALGNRYWPSFYLIDKQGRVRGLSIGETHIGDARARKVETMLDKLLAES